MKKLVIVLDPAHGENVAGKCSPDKTHYEYLWSRERCKALKSLLEDRGYRVVFTTDSINEPGLSRRKNFASALKVEKGQLKLLISPHNNAAGRGDNWMAATGIEVWTSPGVTKSDECADIIIDQLAKDFPDIKMRLNSSQYLQKDKEANFTVLMGADYMAVLIEWLFQDNKKDVELLKDVTVNKRFEKSLVEAIERINNHFSKV